MDSEVTCFNIFDRKRDDMVEKTVVIVNETGLHARPANGLVNHAKKFSSRVELLRENKTANAKSIINILTLDLNKGAEVLVRTNGEDEEAALNEIVDYLENLTE